MYQLIPIGHFAQLTHLSIKALRMYAKEGFLQPIYVDPESGYRYYTLAQAALAARIRLLRLVDMPLEEIREVLQATDPEMVRTHLTSHLQRITDRMARDQQSLLLLQRLLEKPDAFLPFTVKVKEVADQPLLSLCTHAASGTFGQAIRSAFGELFTYAREMGSTLPNNPRLSSFTSTLPRSTKKWGLI
jgi:DNA-binding transcriptional MerR regulator